MTCSKIRAALATAGWASLALIAVGGCGDASGVAKRYPISGNVTYAGKPVETGEISFRPVDADGRGATGTIKDGYYSLTTVTDGDGALPGKYKVTVVSKNVDLSAAKAKSNSAGLRQDDVAKANRTAKNLVPSKYAIPDTSDLSYEVTGSATANFDLKD